MHESPKACFNISKVSLPVLPNLTQNLTHTLCSSTSTIPPISENRRRLMQYTHKDTCNNQTLPHPTTPLGTLNHKTPPQHTLAGNSWTTSDLRVMSNVLGLLDTPLYFYKFPVASVSLLHLPKVQITIVWHVKWCGLVEVKYGRFRETGCLRCRE